MHILCLGINHHNANVALRERLAFTDETARRALARLGCGKEHEGPDELAGIGELAILSTCHRIELYAIASHPAWDALEAFLSESRHVPTENFYQHVYRLEGEKTVEHLMRVAAGLDSMVLGEPQILGQVTHALEMARNQNTAGPILSRLFQAAIHAGKRVRTETAIAQNPATISSVAVRLAADLVTPLETAQVSVLGAGEMAELVVEALRKRGVKKITVVNRTLKRASELAARWQGRPVTFECLPQVLESADILLASTGAPHTLVHQSAVVEAMQARPQRPLVLIDIAVPRDIDPEVGNITGVSLYDMDALQSYLARSLIFRAMEMPEAQAILADEGAEFMAYLDTLKLLPVIKAMRQQAETIRQAELEKTLRHLPDLEPAERECIVSLVETLSDSLVRKLLHAPITRLRSEAASPHAAQFSQVARSLFNLHPAQPDSHDYIFPSSLTAHDLPNESGENRGIQQ